MDEEELLYREMNEEDPFYMGDTPVRHSTHARSQSRKKRITNKRTTNAPTGKTGNVCLADFVSFFIGILLIVLVLVFILG